MKGSCLCGAVTITLPETKTIGACHCSMCRRWGGGPLLVLDVEEEIGIDGAEHVTAYASSDWAERALCSKCGTHLYYNLKGQAHYAVPAGLFQDTDGLELASQIFVDEKPDYYAFANETPMLTGAEVFAMFNQEG